MLQSENLRRRIEHGKKQTFDVTVYNGNAEIADMCVIDSDSFIISFPFGNPGTLSLFHAQVDEYEEDDEEEEDEEDNKEEKEEKEEEKDNKEEKKEQEQEGHRRHRRIFYEEFRVLKIYETGRGFRSKGIAYSREQNAFYMVDESATRIVKFRGLNFMYYSQGSVNADGYVNGGGSVKWVGSYGDGPEQFAGPQFVACNKQFVYVADFGNQRIQILTFDLKFYDRIQLDYRPTYVKASETTLCVSSDVCACFYDLTTKALNYRYEFNFARVNMIDSYFYLYDHREHKMLCFDDRGASLGEIVSNELKQLETKGMGYGMMDYLGDKLVVLGNLKETNSAYTVFNLLSFEKDD